jgi:hypothetical protein
MALSLPPHHQTSQQTSQEAVVSVVAAGDLSVGAPAITCRPQRERRDLASREAVNERVRSEFREMPCLRLSAAQARRLFGLRDDICARVLSELVEEGLLAQGDDGRYGRRREDS